MREALGGASPSKDSHQHLYIEPITSQCEVTVLGLFRVTPRTLVKNCPYVCETKRTGQFGTFWNKQESSLQADSSSTSRATKSWEINEISLQNFGFPSQVGGGRAASPWTLLTCVPMQAPFSGQLPPHGGSRSLHSILSSPQRDLCGSRPHASILLVLIGLAWVMCSPLNQSLWPEEHAVVSDWLARHSAVPTPGVEDCEWR